MIENLFIRFISMLVFGLLAFAVVLGGLWMWWLLGITGALIYGMALIGYAAFVVLA